MTHLDMLRAARAAIATPDKWCQKLRIDRDGRRCAIGAFDGDTACDILGASESLIACIGFLSAALPEEPIYYNGVLVEELGLLNNGVMEWYRVAGYNDSHTHAEVLAVFDRAIARQEVIEDMVEEVATEFMMEKCDAV